MSKNVQYWYCMVPMCKNTSVSAPDKQFVSVPKDATTRKKWCNAINRCNKQNVVLSCKTTRYCCEDHFDLPNDMENFIKHKILSLGSRQLKPKTGVLPHIFDCQQKLTAGQRRSKERNASESNLQYADKAVHLPVGSHGYAMEVSNSDGVPIKTEPGTQTECEVSETYIEIDVPNIKQEILERSERTDQTEDKWTKENEEHHEDEINSTNNQCKVLVNSTTKPKFSCTDCDYVCSRKVYLKNHMMAHNREDAFSCTECKYLCSGKARLRKHMVTHKLEKPFSCSYCSYVSSERSHLKRHMLTHDGEKPFACAECAYTCSLNDNLKRHIAATHVKKVFSCPKCDYSCSQKSDLKDHVKIHSEKKRYPCPKCNYSSSHRFNLSTHMLTHSGVKPFSCSQCNSAFSNRTNLNNHMLTHSGDKPFACPECNYISARLSTLKSHLLTHRID